MTEPLDRLARRPGPTVRTRVTELDEAPERTHEDRLATEEPLEIRLVWPGVEARRVWLTMRTPGHDFELAAGWLTHEGIGAEIAGVAYCTDAELRREQELNVVTVTLASPPTGPARPPARGAVGGLVGLRRVRTRHHRLGGLRRRPALARRAPRARRRTPAARAAARPPAGVLPHRRGARRRPRDRRG